VNAELPSWILLHFSTSPDLAQAGERPWWSPQVLSVDLQRKLTGIAEPPFDPQEYKAELLAELRQLSPESLLSAVRCEEKRQGAIRVQAVDEAANSLQQKQRDVANNIAYPTNSQAIGQPFSQGFGNEYATRAGRFNYGQESNKNMKSQPI